MATEAEIEAIRALQSMSGARRAGQQALNTFVTAGNTATGGAFGALQDVLRGTPWGTSREQTEAQLKAQSPFANTATNIIGLVAGPGAAVAKGYKAAKGIPRAVGRLKEAVAQGGAAAVGARGMAAASSVPKAAKALATAAGVAGGAGLLNAYNSGDAPAEAAISPVTAVDQSLAAGREVRLEAREPTAQDRINAGLAAIMRPGRGFTINEFQAATGALPALTAGQARQTSKDQVYGIASAIAAQQYEQNMAAALGLSGKDRDAAVKASNDEYMKTLLQLMGADATKQVIAEQMARDGT